MDAAWDAARHRTEKITTLSPSRLQRWAELSFAQGVEHGLAVAAVLDLGDDVDHGVPLVMRQGHSVMRHAQYVGAGVAEDGADDRQRPGAVGDRHTEPQQTSGADNSRMATSAIARRSILPPDRIVATVRSANF